ncbi:MAG: phosphoribosylformylglycinamidine synthase II, partial [Acidobacteriaceae bacterium]|nr:phosphoribosylformylglycinamidine synthase II [Acidobacteriaceae bacterium]
PVAATNCLNFGNPEKREIMAQFSATIDGIAEACNALGTPITGGNVSLYNETKGEGIYPTPVMGIVGILEDVTKTVPKYFSRDGDVILHWQPYAVDYDGGTDRFLYERTFGSSEYAKIVLGRFWGSPPDIALAYDARVNKVLENLAENGLVSSVSDIDDGGLAVAISEASFPIGIGARVDLSSIGHNQHTAIQLFGETACTLLITCPRASLEQIKAIVSDSGLGGLQSVGSTGGDSIEILSGGQNLISSLVAKLHAPWSSSLESALHDNSANEAFA